MRIHTDNEQRNTEILRLRATVRGAVQGVGFRPFIYRLATELGLAGWVNNSAQGVFLEVEGVGKTLRAFLLRVERETPPRASVQSLEVSYLDPVGYAGFEIRASVEGGAKTALVLPDIATCPDCLHDIRDPANRRYRYPFTNCTNCGPRYSIIDGLPYDRARTTMRGFDMCPQCRVENADPRDRRFHAQPNACPACGPHVECWTPDGTVRASHDAALAAAVDALCHGQIVAVKGLGGFHLLVDARDDAAVARLRVRKQREEKPFALMYPTLDAVCDHCAVSDWEARLLCAPEAPIVLLRRRTADAPSRAVAPGTPTLGVMLPYTPLHHLLLGDLGFPVVATSGNLSDEPICTDEREALARLCGLADLFLVHDRPIARHVDDSIARVVLDREYLLRRARGYAPLPVPLAAPPLLAVGAHLKNTIAATQGGQAFVSQHIGDLETAAACDAFHQVVASFTNLFSLQPVAVACDLHPDYHSSQFAAASGLPIIPVQHHYAHVLACLAENEVAAPALGVAWDGTGLGSDGTVWGGEFLRVGETDFTRAAHLRAFRLPGGDQAIREPRRSALGVLYAIFGDDAFAMDDLTPVAAFTPREREVLRVMLRRGLNAPVTTSAGRLFDAAAALCGLHQQTRFEGQAAMALEFALPETVGEDAYPLPCAGEILDWAPLMRALIDDVRARHPLAEIATKFHNALVAGIIVVARQVSEPRVALSGGCFQNCCLLERAVTGLRAAGFRPYWHQRIPPNDGGIALGQLAAAARKKP